MGIEDWIGNLKREEGRWKMAGDRLTTKGGGGRGSATAAAAAEGRMQNAECRVQRAACRMVQVGKSSVQRSVDRRE